MREPTAPNTRVGAIPQSPPTPPSARSLPDRILTCPTVASRRAEPVHSLSCGSPRFVGRHLPSSSGHAAYFGAGTRVPSRHVPVCRAAPSDVLGEDLHHGTYSVVAKRPRGLHRHGARCQQSLRLLLQRLLGRFKGDPLPTSTGTAAASDLSIFDRSVANPVPAPEMMMKSAPTAGSIRASRTASAAPTGTPCLTMSAAIRTGPPSASSRRRRSRGPVPHFESAPDRSAGSGETFTRMKPASTLATPARPASFAAR